MAVNLSPLGGVAAQFFNNDGVPLAGGKIYTYLAGSTTPVNTYTTGAGNIAHSNPIILDSAGRVSTGEIWLTDSLAYKFVIKDSTDTLIGTYDNIVGINSNFVNYTSSQEIQTATAGQTVFTLTTMAYQPGTNSLSVFVDGVNQYGPGAQYAFTETSSTSVTFADGLHVGASVKFTTAVINNIGGVDASQVTYDPPFTGSVATNVESKLAQYVNIKDFGAVGDDIVDDSAAIQAALNSGATGIYVPNGTYKLLSTLNVPEGVSIFGSGAKAIFKPRTVNCFLLQASSYVGNVQFSNFTVLGDTANQYAFKYESLVAGNRVTGVLFQNLTTGNIKPGYFNGLWHSTFRSCTFYGCYTGIQFVGQNVKCLIDDCRILKGGTGAGDSTGVYINGAISPIVTGSYKRGEDIQIRNTLIFGFDIAVDAVDVMYFAVTRSDLDYVQKVGVQITQADATCNVVGNWIAIDAATTNPYKGVSFVALGSPRTSQAKVAENVCIGIAGALQSEGVYIGGNQLGVVVDSNELRGFKYGVSLNGGSKARVVNNTFVNSITYDVFMFSTEGNYFAGNNFSGSIYRNATQVGPNQYGENLGYLTRASGSIPVGSGQTTATITLASLGLPSGNPTTGRVTYAVSCMPDVNRGAINASCDGTNVSFTAATPYGPASSLTFTVQAIDN